MMKHSFILLCVACLTTATTLKAQQQVAGSVVDANGMGVTGAKIEIVGTGVTTETNLNGDFVTTASLHADSKYKIRASAIGKKTVTRRYTPGMTLRMKQLTWWNERPERWHIFAGPEIMHSVGDDLMTVGVRVAAAKQFGVFAHFGMTNMQKSKGKHSTWEYVAIGNKYKKGTMVFGAGAMIRLGCPLYFYAGASLRKDRLFLEHLDVSPYGQPDGWIEATGKYKEDYYGTKSIDGIVPEAGLMFNVQKFYVNAGVLPHEDGTLITLGAGMKF